VAFKKKQQEAIEASAVASKSGSAADHLTACNKHKAAGNFKKAGEHMRKHKALKGKASAQDTRVLGTKTASPAIDPQQQPALGEYRGSEFQRNRAAAHKIST
jgi:hypothetical protein